MTPEECMEVIHGKEELWTKAVANNQDSYGHACILATAAVGKALTEGKSNE